METKHLPGKNPKHLKKLFNSKVQNRIFFVSLIESLVRAKTLPNKCKQVKIVKVNFSNHS